MKKKIEEVEQYFKNKLLSKDFEIIKIDEFVMTVLIDEKYKFTIWIGNLDIPMTRELYAEGNYMMIALTESDKFKLHTLIVEDVKKHRNISLYLEKLKQIEALKKEVEDITSLS